MHRTIRLLTIVGLLAAAALAADPRDKPLFDGKWQLQAEKSEIRTVKGAEMQLAIEQQTAGEIRVEETLKAADGLARKRDIKCNTFGRDCGYTEGALAGKMSLYYLGPKLVAIERLGKNEDTVTRRTYSITEDGSTLTLEVQQMVPQRAETDKFVFSKQ